MNGKVLLALALLCVAVFVAGVVTGTLIASVSIHGTGEIKAVGISVSQDSIDWGVIGRAEQKAVTVNVANVNNTAVTLTMRVENWQPVEAADYLLLSWNGEDVVLQAGENRQVTFLLSVADAEIPFGTFSFDVVVTATEVTT